MTKKDTALKLAVSALLENPVYVQKALVILYNRQTASEQAQAQTTDFNGVGFNGRDAEFGTSLATKVLRGWSLSDKQIACGRRMVKKYWRQVSEVVPVEVAPEQAQLAL